MPKQIIVQKIYNEPVSASINGWVYDPFRGWSGFVAKQTQSPSKSIAASVPSGAPSALRVMAIRSMWHRRLHIWFSSEGKLEKPGDKFFDCSIHGAGFGVTGESGHTCKNWLLCPFCRWRKIFRTYQRLLPLIEDQTITLSTATIGGPNVWFLFETLLHGLTSYCKQHGIFFWAAVPAVDRGRIDFLVTWMTLKPLLDESKRQTRNQLIEMLAKALRYDPDLLSLDESTLWAVLRVWSERRLMSRFSNHANVLYRPAALPSDA